MKKTTAPSNSPVYRRALKALKDAATELSNTRDGARGRPSRLYVDLIDKAAALFCQEMPFALKQAFRENAVRNAGMLRQFMRAVRRYDGEVMA